MRIPALSIIFLFVFSILIDLYITLDIRQMWKKKGVVSWWICCLLCYALLIVAISLPRRDADAGISAVMWLLFIYLSIYAGKFIYFLCSVFGRFVRLAARIRWDWYPSRLVGAVLGVAFIGMMWIGAGYTRNHIMVVHEDFYS